MRISQRQRAAIARDFIVCLVAVGALAYSTAGHPAPVTVTSNDVLTVNFRLPTAPTNNPDWLGFSMSLDSATSVDPTSRPTTATLRNGTTVLGTFIQAPTSFQQFMWTAPSSTFGSVSGNQTQPVDFSSIWNGTIDGSIQIRPGSGRTYTIDSAKSQFGTDGGVGDYQFLLQYFDTSVIPNRLRGALDGIPVPQPIITGVSVAPAPATFFDDFNRPDGPVGNGWTTGARPGSGPGTNLVIQNNTVIGTGFDGAAFISRDIGYNGPVTMSATISGGSIGVPFETVFFFGGDGTFDGATLYLSFEGRSSSFQSGTFISIYDPNKSTSVSIGTTNPFPSGTIDVTFDPATGNISGHINAPGYVFNYPFAGTYDLSNVTLTNKIGIDLNVPVSWITPAVPPTIDDVSINYTGGGSPPPVPTFSINNVSADEGNAGITPFVFSVTLSAPSASTVTVNYATADSTATAGSDYTATSGVLTFSPGVTTQTITVNVIGDTTAEPTETFFMNLSSPSGATLAVSQGTGTIQNDDAAVVAPSNCSLTANGANPLTLQAGGGVVTLLVSCNGGGVPTSYGWTGSFANGPLPTFTRGNTQLGNIVTTTTFTVYASNSAGSSAATSVTVTVTPPALPILPPPAPAPSPVTFELNHELFLFPSLPTVVITHGWEPCVVCTSATPTWESDMANRIHNLGANVITVVWSDAFTRSLQSATSEVANVGRELAAQLSQFQGGIQRTAGIQFIGHSLGSLVNAYAANVLIQQGLHVDQFTILDRPFGQGIFNADGTRLLSFDADGPIFRTVLPKGKVTWVDNYYGNNESLLHLPFAVGAKFKPNAKAFDYLYNGANHPDVHDRYLATIPATTPSTKSCPATGGFLCSIAGGGFSVRQPDDWDPLLSLLDVPHNPLSINPVDWLLFNCQIALGKAMCQEGSPAYLWLPNFTIGDDDVYLSFEFEWANVGDGDWLTLHFGNNLLFSFSGLVFSGSDFTSSGLIPIKQFGGQTNQLLFTLHSVRAPNAAVSIRNVQVTTFIPVEIDIKPGGSPNSINSTSSGNIPVAILSTETFNAPARIAQGSLTFGRSGDEPSLLFCNQAGEDVNGDGLLDLVCHFDTTRTGFRIGDARGLLKGQTLNGISVVGADSVRIVH